MIFGLTVLLAITFYNLTHRGLTLLIAGVLILGAGFGELVTVIFLLTEMGYQEVMSLGAIRYMQGILIAAALFVNVFAPWEALRVVRKDEPAAGGTVASREPTVDEDRDEPT